MKKKAHRFRSGTDAHATADRSDAAPRRPRHTKPMSEGGTRPDLAPCPTCGARVVHHKLAGGAPILLEPEELELGAEGARFVVIFGFVVPDPNPGAVPEGMLYHRKHACPGATAR